MATKQQLIDYVKNCFQRSMPEWQIRKNLASTGWSNYEINNAINSAIEKIASMGRAEAQDPAILKQQLIDYVKNCFQREVSLEQIKKSLISTGWSDNEINEAVSMVQQEMPSYRKFESKRALSEIISGPAFKLFLIPALIMLALLIIIAPLYFVFNGNNEETISMGPSETTGFNDCKSNFQCFIDASKNCEKTKVKKTYKTNVLGVEKTISNYYELRGIEDDKCLFYLRVESIDIEYSKELIWSMIDSGISKDVIKQREKVENIQTNAKEGSEETCKIKTSDLTSVLETWKSDSLKVGIFPNEVLSYAGCRGSYFS